MPLGIKTKTFQTWLKRFPQLAECYEQVKYIRASKLIKNGLKRTHEAGLTKFLLFGLIPQECREIQTIINTEPEEESSKVKYIIMKDIGSDGQTADQK